MRLVTFESSPFHTLRYETSGPSKSVRTAELPFFRATATGISGTLVLSADLQGRVNNELLGVALAAELEVLAELEEIPRPSGIVLAGDLYDHPQLQKLGASGEVAEVFTALRRIAAVVGVLGNHDRLNAPPNHCVVLDGNAERWQGIQVGGVSGIIGDPKRPMRRRPADFQAQIRRVLAKRLDLLLLHQGPPGGSGQRGAEEILEVLAPSRDLLLVCGHCHWPEPLADIGRIQVLNVDARVVIVTPSKKPC